MEMSFQMPTQTKPATLSDYCGIAIHTYLGNYSFLPFPLPLPPSFDCFCFLVSQCDSPVVLDIRIVGEPEHSPDFQATNHTNEITVFIGGPWAAVGPGQQWALDNRDCKIFRTLLLHSKASAMLSSSLEYAAIIKIWVFFFFPKYKEAISQGNFVA